MTLLGKRLRELRQQKGLSLEEVGRLLSMSFNAIAMYERGERTPPAHRLQRLADFYGVSVDYLLGRTDDPGPRGTRTGPRLPENNLLPERLRKARQMAGLSQREVASKLNVTQQAVSSWETGTRRPDPDVLVQLAKLYRVPVSYLLGEPDQPVPGGVTPDPRDLPAGIGGVPVRLVPVPVVGRVHAGESMPPTEHLEGYEWMAEDDVRGGTYFILIVRGDCMDGGPAPIREGYRVLVRVQPEVEDGQVAVVFLPGEDEAVLRRVRKAGEHVVLTADNPSYPPVVLRPEDVRIVGRVVQVTFEPAAARDV